MLWRRSDRITGLLSSCSNSRLDRNGDVASRLFDSRHQLGLEAAETIRNGRRPHAAEVPVVGRVTDTACDARLGGELHSFLVRAGEVIEGPVIHGTLLSPLCHPKDLLMKARQ